MQSERRRFLTAATTQRLIRERVGNPRWIPTSEKRGLSVG